LRKKAGIPSNGWEVVGETYVHGIMKGEVIEKWKLRILETRQITLYYGSVGINIGVTVPRNGPLGAIK
jgi:hypothetical protein